MKKIFKKESLIYYFRDEIKALSFRSLNTLENTPINDIKVTVVVGECDSPIFIQESKRYAQV